MALTREEVELMLVTRDQKLYQLVIFISLVPSAVFVMHWEDVYAINELEAREIASICIAETREKGLGVGGFVLWTPEWKPLIEILCGVTYA